MEKKTNGKRTQSIFNKEGALTLIQKKRARVYEVRNSNPTDKDIQRLCVNELSRLGKLLKKINNLPDDCIFNINPKDDIFKFKI
jgi:hypothetical protein